MKTLLEPAQGTSLDDELCP
uniref:Uncharacterized protein n=1 Tax=Arundo donax TaxID=35708 RepID=A0A0A9HDM4_ARUDO